MLRYLHRLEGARSLADHVSMIPLGSCTMKLNATAQMAAVYLAGVRCQGAPVRASPIR